MTDYPNPKNLYEFALALFILWLVLVYFPKYGGYIGGSILLLYLVSTAVSGKIVGLIDFVKNPFYLFNTIPVQQQAVQSFPATNLFSDLFGVLKGIKF